MKINKLFKKISAITAYILILISITALTACNINEKNKPITNTNTPTDTISDYYPFMTNVKLTYEGSGMEYASNTTYVDFVKGSRIQLRTNNGGTEVCQVREIKDGELRLITSVPECYYRDDFTPVLSDKPEILLKEPLVKGTTWKLRDGRKSYISNIGVAITTPLGSYKAIEVTTENNFGKDLAYYAKGVGLVKFITVLSDNNQITTTLSKIEKNVPFTQQIKVYYEDVENNKLVYMSTELSFKTNDSTKALFENLFKNPLIKGFVAISTNTKINNLYLDTKNQTVYVDFSNNLISDINVGTAGESALLYSITSTLGSYYNANKICLTLDGKPYQSGHIAMKEGETFTVDIKNPVEYKK